MAEPTVPEIVEDVAPIEAVEVAPVEVAVEKPVVDQPTPIAQDSEFDFDFGINSEFEFDFSESVNVGVKKERTPDSKKELSLMASLYLDMPFDYIANQALQGDESLINEALLSVDSDLQSQSMAKATEAITTAKTPEDVITFLTKLKESQAILPTLSEQRAAYVADLGVVDEADKKELNFDNVSPILAYTLKNNIIAADVLKQKTDYEGSQTYSGMALDFLEIVLPLTGAGEEEASKATSEIYRRADEFNDMPFENQRELVKQLVEAASTQETILFNNNNSFMQGGQIDTFYNSILQGGLNDPDSNITAAERGAILETAFNSTIFVGEAVGMAKSFGKLVKFLMRRIHSNKALKAGVEEEEKWARLIIQRQATFNLDPNVPSNTNIQVEGSFTSPSIQPTTVDSRVTLAGLQKADGGFNATGYTGYYRTVAQREGSSVLDSQFAFSPKSQYQMEDAVGLEGMPKAMNMTNEQVVERFLPTVTPDTDIGLNNIASPRSLTDLILADDTLSNIGMRMGRELERANGTSLKPQISGTRFNEGTSDSSLGSFTFLLGDGDTGGFKRLSDAQGSADKAALGYDYKIVKKETGFYVEMEVEHYTNPFNDTKGLDVKKGTTPSKLTAWALNHARIVEEDMIRGLYALKGVNRSIVQKMEARAKKAMFISPEKNLLLMKMLEKGDTEAAEWVTKSSLEKVFGTVPDDVYDSYRTIRDIYDDVYVIKERNYYNALRAANQKVISLGMDFDNNLGSVMNVKSLQKKGGKKLDGDGLIYDIITKQLVPKESLSESDIVVELGHAIKVGDDTRTYVRVPPQNVKKLQAGDTLSYGVGHIDRMYREAGWVVKKDVIKKVNGVDVRSSRIVNIVKTESEARALEDANKGIFASPSRENTETDFAREDSVQFGPSAAHTKKRGELVKGADGSKTAGVLNAFESLFSTIGSLQNSLDFNVMKATEIKFFKAFEGVLKEGSATRYENDISKMYIEEKWNRLTPDMRTEFINHHSYLKSLRHYMYDGWMSSADQVLNKVFNKVGVEVNSQKAVGAIQQKTSVLGIVWNGLYQANQNTIQAMFAIASSPKNGGKAVMALPALINASLTGDLSGLSKILKSETRAQELYDALATNGLIDAVGRSNDFLDLARTAGGNVSVGKVKAVAKGVAEATMFPTFKRASQGIQETPLVVGNALAYLTEYFELMAKNGGVFKGREQAEISFQAQKRMLTQNSLDQFWFQNRGNPLSFVGQFMQAVYKTFLDTVVEPQWEAIRLPLNAALKQVTDRELGSLGKNKARVTDTYTKAFITSALVYTAFGPEGGLGKSLGSSLEDFVRSQYKTTADMPPVLDGFFNGMASEMANGAMKAAGVEGKLDVNQTMSPSAFLDMFSSLVAGDFPQVNLLGASAFMINNVAESAYSSTLIALNSFTDGSMSTPETLALLSAEVLEPFKLLDSGQKAYIAYHTARNATSTSLSSDDRITKGEAIASLFGYEPELLTDKMYRMKFSQGDGSGITDMSFYAKKSTNTALQIYARRLTYEMDMGTLTRERQQVLYAEGVAFAKRFSSKSNWDAAENAFKERALKETPPSYNETIKPQITGNTLEGIVKALRITSQKADGHSEEAEEVLNNLRENYELMQGDK
jgi:hypothetical protein